MGLWPFWQPALILYYIIFICYFMYFLEIKMLGWLVGDANVVCLCADRIRECWQRKSARRNDDISWNVHSEKLATTNCKLVVNCSSSNAST